MKDTAYDDTRYVVELVAPGTVNTMPESTLEAVVDHGQIRGDTIRPYYDDAKQTFEQLKTVGIDMDDVVRVLEDQGVEKFVTSWMELLGTVETELSKAKGR